MREKEIYKLLIADDEYWIRDEIAGLIDWEHYSIKLLESAVDGEDALNKIEKETPDILITDVNMPFINGVELLKRVKTKYPNMVVIMLSGYNDFEYVKESLTNGAMDYLLKPIPRMDLIKVMTKALEVINKNVLAQNEREIERSRLLRAASSLNDREYSFLITREKKKTDTVSSFMMSNSMTIPETGYSIIMVKIHDLSSRADIFNYDLNLLSFSIKQHIEEAVELNTLLVFNNIYATSEFILVVNEKKDVIKEKAYFLLVALKKFTNCTISMGISNMHFSEAEMNQGYKEAKKAYMMREFSEGSVVNLYSDVLGNRQKAEEIVSQFESKFDTFYTQNPDKLKENVLELIENTRIKEDWTLYEMDKCVKVIMHKMLGNTHHEMDPDATLEIENTSEMLVHAVENMEYEEVISLLEMFLDAYSTKDASIQLQQAAKTSIEMIPEIVNYIDDHYFESLSLSGLADKYHVESTYLSKIFKKETGKTLINYIVDKRIEKAVTLMQEDNPSLTEIAFEVGYDDYTYFNKVFKKTKGISPRDYLNNLKG